MDKLLFYEIDSAYINNAKAVYNHKLTNDGKSKLSQRCLDFKLLEEKCKKWVENNTNGKK